MPPLSASDALSPAIRHASSLFFQPFRPDRSWKLALTVYLSRYGLFFCPFFLPILLVMPLVHNKRDWQADLIAAGFLLFCVLFCYLYYLCSRLQFVTFDIVLRRQHFVAPSWNAHRTQSHRWLLFQLIFGTCVTLLLGLPIAISGLPIIRNWPPDSRSNQLPAPFEHIFLLFATIFLGSIAVFTVAAIVNDLALPVMALEDVTVPQAFSRVRQLLSVDPWSYVRFFLLKGVGGLVSYFVCMIAAEIVILIAAMIFGLVLGLIGYLLNALGVPWTILHAIGEAFAIILYLVIGLYASPIAIGFFFAALDAWTLYFLAGRYTPVGDILATTAPAARAPFVPTNWPLPYVPPPTNWPGQQ